MATQVEQMLKATLKELIVAGDEASIPAIEAVDFMFRLNNLMAEIEAPTEVDLAWTAVANVNDTLTSPESINRALIILMAVDLADAYGIDITGSVVASKADWARDKILTVGTTMTSTYKPPTLPKGSGNQGSRILDQIYYSGSE